MFIKHFINVFLLLEYVLKNEADARTIGYKYMKKYRIESD